MTSPSARTPPSTAVLTIRLGEARYAFSIEDVVEVAAMVSVTALTDKPPEWVGLVNRRGTFIPLIDLRRVEDIPSTPITPESLFVVIQHEGQLLAVLVDDVIQVESIPADRFLDVTDSGIRGIINHHLFGIVKVLAAQPLVTRYSL